MLHKLMEMKLFYYGIAGAGGIALLTMLVLNQIGAKHVQNKESYEKFTNRLRNVSAVGGVLGLLFTGVAIFGTFQADYGTRTRYEYLLAGVGVAIGLFVAQKGISFVTKERSITDFLLEYKEEFTRKKIREKPQQRADFDVEEITRQKISRHLGREQPVENAGKRERNLVSEPKQSKRQARKAARNEIRNKGKQETVSLKEQNMASQTSNVRFSKVRTLETDTEPQEQLLEAAKKDISSEEESSRREVIDNIVAGIKESAAGTTRFSKYLTQEEEGILREVIKEYMT